MNRAEIMRNAHKIAKGARDCYESYKEALAVGLTLAWKIAKCLVSNVEGAIEIARKGIVKNESAEIVCNDAHQEYVQRMVGNVA